MIFQIIGPHLAFYPEAPNFWRRPCLDFTVVDSASGRFIVFWVELLPVIVLAYKCLVGLRQVTFRDPESARKACEDPTPVIDGRRANCNLASLGRAQPAVPLGIVLPTDACVHILIPV